MKAAVLFDLGNTLASYYRPEEFSPILEEAIADLVDELRKRGLLRVSLEEAITASARENQEAADFRFTPIIERFERIFAISLAHDPAFQAQLCRVFLRPIFALGRAYEDSVPALKTLRAAGHPTAIVSNAPWGSPPEFWHAEISRLGLASYVDRIVMCGDVGWRKPARKIFQSVAAALGRAAQGCVFAGDDLRWDVEGSAAAGMRPVLVDRASMHVGYAGARVEGLDELPELIAALAVESAKR